MKPSLSSLALLPVVLAIGCGEHKAPTDQLGSDTMQNPLSAKSTLVFQAPVFDKLTDSDYRPAIEAGMKKQLEEVAAIADNKEPATFENTIVALEKSGVDFTLE